MAAFRRCLLGAGGALAFFIWDLPAGAAVEKVDVNLDYVIAKALERAREPFKSPRGSLPEELSVEHLNYDRYRQIRFNEEEALWRKDGRPFWTAFFHPGYIYQEPVQLHEFTPEGYTQPIRFAPDFFDYTHVPGLREKIPAEAGYAGFKVLYPLNDPNRMDELAVFQGASYFRLLGKGSNYGQSARGLAINCGEGEEFPLFTDFWLGKPEPEADRLRIYAILDSRSCTGAYQFTLKPGDWTRCEVKAVLFWRPEEMIRASYEAEKIPYEGLKTVGIAPLTSMFWFGENTENKPDDYRAEVHDSDGLLIKIRNGETVWRPLTNPPVKDQIRHSVFEVANLEYFGLLQRDHDYQNYHEITNQYHKNPSFIIKPQDDWGEGQVRLVEIGTVNEYFDNIVAFWNPKTRPVPLEPYRISYRIEAGSFGEERYSPNYVKATRIGAAPENPKVRDFVIDFTGEDLQARPAEQLPEVIVSCPEGRGHFSKAIAQKNPIDGSWRVFLKFEPAPGNSEPIPLRCTLKDGDKVLSETWDYLWTPRNDKS